MKCGPDETKSVVFVAAKIRTVKKKVSGQDECEDRDYADQTDG